MNSNILFSLRNKQSCLFLNKELALKPGSERALFLFRVSGIPLLVSAKGDIIFARPYGGIQGVRWSAGHMGPALHGIFVEQGTRALLWVRYGIGGRTGASAPTEMSEHLRRAACPHAAVMVRWLTGGGLRAARPTEAYFAVRRGGALPLPRATARVAPTEGYKECGAGERIPQSRLRRASPL